MSAKEFDMPAYPANEALFNEVRDSKIGGDPYFLLSILAWNAGGAVPLDVLVTRFYGQQTDELRKYDIRSLWRIVGRTKQHVPEGWHIYAISGESAYTLFPRYEENTIVPGPTGFRETPDWVLGESVPEDMRSAFDASHLVRVGHHSWGMELYPELHHTAFDLLDVLGKNWIEKNRTGIWELSGSLSVTPDAITYDGRALNSFLRNYSPKWEVIESDDCLFMEHTE